MGKSSGEKSKVKVPDFLKNMSKEARDAARASYAQGPLEYFPGETVAPFTEAELMGQQSQMDFAQNMLPGLNQQVFGSFGNALDASNVVGNPAVQAGLGAIESRAMRNFGENILPQLRQQATGTGNMYSSKAEQSERLAGRDLQGMISEAQAGLLTGTLGDAMRLQGAALATAPSTLGTGMMGGNIMQGVGGQQRAMDQAQIAADMERFNFEQQAPRQLYQQYINQLAQAGGVPGGMTTASSGGGGGSGVIGNMMGGAMLGGSAGGMFGGAASGAATGSTFGPYGAMIGAGLGLLGTYI